MKRLFVISNDYEIDLNREWLHLVPEFSKILHRRWLCEGDADGRKKVMARRIFGYIYLMLDYSSHIFTWEEDARRAEALKIMSLKPGDIDSEGVTDAYDKYQEMVEDSSVILKSLRSVYTTIQKMQQFMDEIDFTKTDKQGKLLYTPSQAIKGIKDMNAMYDAVQQLERRVLEDLKKEANTIRGMATLGGKEGKRGREWKEGIGPTQTELQKSVEIAIESGKEITGINTSPDFRQIGGYLMDITKNDEDSDGGEY